MDKNSSANIDLSHMMNMGQDIDELCNKIHYKFRSILNLPDGLNATFMHCKFASHYNLI